MITVVGDILGLLVVLLLLLQLQIGPTHTLSIDL